MTERRTATGVFLEYFLVSIGTNAYILAPASIVPLPGST
jgi:hypothetical protein